MSFYQHKMIFHPGSSAFFTLLQMFTPILPESQKGEEVCIPQKL
jgi:hypothetical protein